MKLTQAIENPALSDSIKDLEGSSFLNVLLPNFIGIGFIVGVIIFFFVLMIGAIQWISSGGDKAKIETSRGKLTSGFVGLVILFSLFAIGKIVESFFGISIFELDLDQFIISL